MSKAREAPRVVTRFVYLFRAPFEIAGIVAITGVVERSGCVEIGVCLIYFVYVYCTSSRRSVGFPKGDNVRRSSFAQ